MFNKVILFSSIIGSQGTRAPKMPYKIIFSDSKMVLAYSVPSSKLMIEDRYSKLMIEDRYEYLTIFIICFELMINNIKCTCVNLHSCIYVCYLESNRNKFAHV